METDTQHSKWLKALAMLLAMVGIFYTQDFVSGNTTRQKLVRIAIKLAAFAVLPVGYRLWFSHGKRQISATRWIVFLAILVVGLPAANFLLPAFRKAHPSIGNIWVRFASSTTFDWLPAVVLGLTIVYVISKMYGASKPR